MSKKQKTKKNKDYQEFKHNPRKLKGGNDEEALEHLRESMARLGDLSGITYNRRSKQLVTGNQRSKGIKLADLDITIQEEYSEPNAQGTVALGFVIFEGERFFYREVDWDKETEEEANIVGNVHPADWYPPILEKEWGDGAQLLDWGVSKKALEWARPKGPEVEEDGKTRMIKNPYGEVRASNVRMFQLFLTEETVAEFERWVVNIMTEEGYADKTEAVFETIKKYYEQHHG